MAERYQQMSNPQEEGDTFSGFVSRKAVKALRNVDGMVSISRLTTLVKNDKSSQFLQLKPITLWKILQKYPEKFVFRGNSQPNKNAVEVGLFIKLEICDDPKRCTGYPRCRKLHICLFFIRDLCRNTGQKHCPYGHRFTSAHNKKVLHDHKLDHLQPNAIKDLMMEQHEESPPLEVCNFYNSPKGCRSDIGRKKCPYLHLCSYFLKGCCRYGRKCKKNHDLLSPNNLEILARNNFNTDRDFDDILADLRKEVYGDDSSYEVDDDDEYSDEMDKSSFRGSYHDLLEADHH